jgi:TetR/AcrR family transcriptional regulator, transcriptional repressor for nem operon
VRYAPEHKDETRTKVLRAAASAMRTLGTNGVGVADIMRSVGLTHGGFYAHFQSRDDLVAQAVAFMFTDLSERYARRTAGMSPSQALGVYIDGYVSARHRDDAARGCPLTSITADAARGDGAARAAFDAGVRSIVDRLAAWLPPGTEPAEARAAALLSSMAGCVALARAVSDASLSDSILEAGRRAARAAAGLSTDPAGAAA